MPALDRAVYNDKSHTGWQQVTLDEKMQVRKTQLQDLEEVLDIYQQARDFMKETGNPFQWGESWPPSHLIEEDILQQKSYVCVESLPPTADTSATEAVVAVFFLEMADDPTYRQIYPGQWIEPQQPYGVVHRLASSRSVRGAATFCLQWALKQCGNIRIDTHQANLPMRNLLQKLGYHYCGVIHTHDGTPRLAYQQVRKKTGHKTSFCNKSI